MQSIEKGTEVLILKNPSFDKQYSRYLYYTNFIKGTVINVNYEFNKYDNESHKIYTVLGEDCYEYKGEYGDYSDLPDAYFFLTMADYKKQVKSIMQRKIEETNQIKSDLSKFFDAYQTAFEINTFKIYNPKNKTKKV